MLVWLAKIRNLGSVHVLSDTDVKFYCKCSSFRLLFRQVQSRRGFLYDVSQYRLWGECLFNISPGCLLSGITLALALHSKMLLNHTKVTPWLQRCISVFVHTVKDRALTVFLELWSKLKLSNCYAKLLSLIYRLHSCKFSALHENSLLLHFILIFKVE